MEIEVSPQRSDFFFTRKNIVTILSAVLILTGLFLMIRILFLLKLFRMILKYWFVSLLTFFGRSYLLIFSSYCCFKMRSINRTRLFLTKILDAGEGERIY
jgi:hypothetical protein